jgi:hypothetical protein
MELVLVGYQLPAPAATGVTAVSGLDPGRYISLGHSLTGGIVAVLAGTAKLGEPAH